MAHHLTGRSCWTPTSCAASASSPVTVSNGLARPSQQQQIVTWNTAKYHHNFWGRFSQRKLGEAYSKWEAARKKKNTFLFWPKLQQQPTKEEIKQMKAFWKSETTEINLIWTILGGSPSYLVMVWFWSGGKCGGQVCCFSAVFGFPHSKSILSTHLPTSPFTGSGV